mmetsp:Transcript_54075/g.128799  ORF Transcript_54075/g.128799 Transcript_54075/m.128799 type:complete len:196 (+) Transcript_54075:68-655(+)
MGNIQCCCEDKSGYMATVVAEVHNTRSDKLGYTSQTVSVEPRSLTEDSAEIVNRPEVRTAPGVEELGVEAPEAKFAPPEETPEAAVPVPQQPNDEEDMTFYAEVQKDEKQKLGMIIAYFSMRQCVQVKSIREEGAVAKWNMANPDRRIVEGYYILEANGTKFEGKTEKEVSELLDSSSRIMMLISKEEPRASAVS